MTFAYPLERVPDLDLGHDHYLNWVRWAPDDLPANRERLKIPQGPLPVIERWGATIRHYRTDPGREQEMCESMLTFDGEWQRRLCLGADLWTVLVWEPLTLSPSIECRCGSHGYIREGKWIGA